jgi:hypothetical protein
MSASAVSRVLIVVSIPQSQPQHIRYRCANGIRERLS